MLQEEDGVVAPDRGAQEPVGVERVGRQDDPQSGNVRHQDRARLGVIDGAAADVAADRDAHHDRTGPRVSGAPPHRRELAPDLHVCGPDVVVELDLDHRFQAPQRHPDRAADDVGFRERRVEDPLLPIDPLQVVGDLEDAPFSLALLEHRLARGVGDVLAEEHDPWIALHLVAHAGVQEVHHRGRGGAFRRRGGRREHRRGRIDVGRVDEVVGGFGGRDLRRQGAVRGFVDFCVDLLFQPLERCLRENPLADQETRHRRDRIASEVALALLFWTVERLVVGERMAVRPDDVRVDQRGALPRPAVFDRRAQRIVGLHEIAAVDFGDREVREAGQELRDRAARRVDLDRDRDGVTVVFDQVEDGELQVARGRERFPELPLGGLALSGRDVDDLVAPETPAGGELRDLRKPPPSLCRPNRVEKLRPGAGGLRDQVQPARAPVRRHLTPGRGGIVLRPDGLKEHLVGRDPDLQAEGAIAVVTVEPVVGGLDDHAGGGRDRLVPGAVDLEVDLVLAFELDFLVVDPAGKVDVAVGRDEPGGIKASVFV